MQDVMFKVSRKIFQFMFMHSLNKVGNAQLGLLTHVVLIENADWGIVVNESNCNQTVHPNQSGLLEIIVWVDTLVSSHSRLENEASF